MAAPIRISYHRFDPPQGFDERLRERIARLDRFEDDIADGRVVIEGAHRHGSKTVVEISVELELPRKKRVVGKRSADYPSPAGRRSVTQAMSEAFHVAERQLRQAGATRRHDVKTPEHPDIVGRVVELDRAARTGFV